MTVFLVSVSYFFHLSPFQYAQSMTRLFQSLSSCHYNTQMSSWYSHLSTSSLPCDCHLGLLLVLFPPTEPSNISFDMPRVPSFWYIMCFIIWRLEFKWLVSFSLLSLDLWCFVATNYHIEIGEPVTYENGYEKLPKSSPHRVDGATRGFDWRNLRKQPELTHFRVGKTDVLTREPTAACCWAFRTCLRFTHHNGQSWSRLDSSCSRLE